MRKIYTSISKYLTKLLNRSKLNIKFFVLYFFCVICPLIVTDSIIIKSVYEREVNSYQYDMEYVSNLYKNYLINVVENDKTLANSVNMNDKINTFINAEYSSPYDYYTDYYSIITGSYLETLAGLSSDHICVYADNNSILDSVFFKKLSGVRDSYWYSTMLEDGASEGLYLYYDEDEVGKSLVQKRKIYYVKRMTYYKRGCEKVVVIENDPSAFQRELKDLGNKYPMYIKVDGYVVFTNMGDSILYESEIRTGLKASYTTSITLAGTTFEIVIFNNRHMLTAVLNQYAGVIISLILFTILIPYVTLKLIEKSIISRILKLEDAFGEDSDDTFKKIENIDGTDEIAILMTKYNDMVDITNNLVTTVYKDKLKEQESDIARKNAELLALQSQINPHFLFNALESIRMHSLLKGEDETSVMVGKLAVMQRQNVEWGQDFVSIKKEMESIEAYLYLQSYRFGERLNFELDVDDDCAFYLIPKLTIVTFVENACVHGIESKSTPGWIFVRAYRDEDYLYIEVEDTGGGMTEEEVEAMKANINNVSIEVIKGKKHVGVLNACLRLKMITDNMVEFDIDSEAGVGMSVEIKIPLDKLRMLDEKES